MAKKQPNILWICTDSQRWDTLGCYGNKFVHTPNLDQLANNGIYFENCYAQNPLCTPSRGGFLTGRYPVTNRLRQNGQDISENEVLVTRLLAEDNYVCGLSGKLHLSACNWRFKNFKEGDEWWALPPYAQLCKGTERRINDGYSEFYWDHCPSPHYAASAYNRWVQEKGAIIETHLRDDSQHVGKGIPGELHQTTFCVDKAIGFINAYSKESTPWLFSVNIFDPHFPFNPPEEYLEPYLKILDEIPLPNFKTDELESKPDFHKIRHRQTSYGYCDGISNDHEHRMVRAAYWAMCDQIDVQVGRLLEALRKSGQDRDTMVIFTSDHGELLGDHGLYTKGPFLYDPCIRVPLIISWPGVISPGRQSGALIELNDIAPTILEAAGLERHPGIQARSLMPLLNGTCDINRFREDVYCEYYNSNPDPEKVYLTMVRDDEYKIIVAHNRNTGELYHLITDPGENVNLWNEPQYTNDKLRMLKKVTDRMSQTCDPLPERIGIF